MTNHIEQAKELARNAATAQSSMEYTLAASSHALIAIAEQLRIANLIGLNQEARVNSTQSGPVDVKTDKDSHTRSQEQETPKEIVVGAYTPTDSEVKEAYQRGEFVNKAMSEQRWQRWLRTVKAKAWDEGYVSGFEEDKRFGATPNPYESEEA